jgi:hypothetical protein
MTGSLDLALEYLRGHRLPYRWSETDIRLWEAVCPNCRHASWGLQIREPYKHGQITLRCATGCTTDQIRQALEQPPAHPHIQRLEEELDHALDLAQHAHDIAHDALNLARAA